MRYRKFLMHLGIVALAGWFGWRMGRVDLAATASVEERSETARDTVLLPTENLALRKSGNLDPVRDFAKMSDSFEKTIALRQLREWLDVLDGMGPEDAHSLMELIDEKTASGRNFGMFHQLLLERWAEVDGTGAWAYLTDKGEDYDYNVDHFFKAWYLADPAAVANTVSGMFDSPRATKAMEGLLHGWAETDLASCVNFVATRLDEAGQVQAAVHVAGSVVQQSGLVEAQRWYDSLPLGQTPAFETEAARVLFYSLYSRNAEDALSFATERVTQPWAGNLKEQSWVAGLAARNGLSPWEFVAGVAAREDVSSEQSRQLAVTVLKRYQQTQGGLETWIAENPGHSSTGLLSHVLEEMVIKK